jgi:hypothetical protein
MRREWDSLRVNASVEESTLQRLGTVTQSHGAFSIIVRINTSPLSHLVTFRYLAVSLDFGRSFSLRLWPWIRNLR